MLIVILADTRVGSTALGLGLSAQGKCHFHGEILYPERSDRSDHLYGKLAGAGMEMLLDQRRLFAMLDEFFAPFHKAPTVSICDIKYHDLSIVPSHPSELLALPQILNYLVSRFIPILHLNRRNKLAAALSQVVVRETGVHHQSLEQSDSYVDPVKITIDIYDIFGAARAREESHRIVRRWLRDYGRVIEAEYEAIFGGADGMDLLFSALKSEWGIMGLSYTPKLEKRTHPQIVNIDEVRTFFHGTRWELSAIEAFGK